MLESLSTTQSLGALMGLYFLAAGIGLLVDRRQISELYKDLRKQPMLGYLGGVMAFLVGGAIVALHNDWNGVLASLVSFIGWMALVKGMLLMAFRKQFFALFEPIMISTSFASVIGSAALLAGLALLWASLGG